MPTASDDGAAPRRLILLGATGSIGRSAVDVVEHLARIGGPRFEIVGAAAQRSADRLAELARRCAIPHLALADAEAVPLAGGCPAVDTPAGTTWSVGPDAAVELVHACVRPGDLVLSAIVGVAGLAPTLAAIERGATIALANKETLVAGGAIVMPRAQAAGVPILPVDSEHAGLAQCLLAARDARDPREVASLVLTASGGPFRTWSKDRMAHATPEQALDHPTWSMGAKVTVDSASLLNKALELIEAHHLFDVPAERLEVLVHPQSIVHAMVRFADHSVVAQLAAPDMRTPIQQALTWPDRHPGAGTPLDWTALRSLEFEPVDDDRFPAPGLALEVIRRGGTAGATFNAAGEVAVEAFLAGRLPFGRIVEVVRQVTDAHVVRPVTDLDDVTEADAAARAAATELIRASVGASAGAAPTER